MLKSMSSPKLKVIWETSEQPDSADLLLVFDMLLPEKQPDLTDHVKELSLRHPQYP